MPIKKKRSLSLELQDEDKSRPSPPPWGAHRCVLQHNSAVEQRDNSNRKSVKHFISFFSRAVMILFPCQKSLTGSVDRLKPAVLSPKVWQAMSIICKAAQRGQTGRAARLEMEGTVGFQSGHPVGFSGSNNRSWHGTIHIRSKRNQGVSAGVGRFKYKM